MKHLSMLFLLCGSIIAGNLFSKTIQNKPAHDLRFRGTSRDLIYGGTERYDYVRSNTRRRHFIRRHRTAVRDLRLSGSAADFIMGDSSN